MVPVVVLPQVSPQPSYLLLADQEVPRRLPWSDAQVLQVSSSAARQHQAAHTAERSVCVRWASLCGIKEYPTSKTLTTLTRKTSLYNVSCSSRPVLLFSGILLLADVENKTALHYKGWRLHLWGYVAADTSEKMKYNPESSISVKHGWILRLHTMGYKTIYQDFQLWNGAGYRLKVFDTSSV